MELHPTVFSFFMILQVSLVSSNVRLSKRHIDSINRQRAKGVSTMDALAKMGALETVDRDAKKLARTRAKSPIIRYGTWGTIPSPEHVTKEHINYLKNTFKQQRTIKGRIRQVLNEGSKLIGKRK